MVTAVLNKKELEDLQQALQGADRDKLHHTDLGLIYTSLTGRAWHPMWNPLPGPQTLAYDSLADELYFGGAAGGGKSDLILGLSVRGDHHRSLILRRIASYLKGMVDRLQHIAAASSKAKWRSSGHGGVLYGLDGRATVELGGCQDEKDKENYQGFPHDLLGFDEISHFTRSQYYFITAWNRSTRPGQRCRVVCAGNPPLNPEGRWIVEEWAPWLDETFPDPAKPGELRWYTTIEGKTKWLKTGDEVQIEGRKLKPRSRTFIPSRLSDNPILDATDYGARLAALHEPLRSQLLYGDMNAGQEDEPNQVIPTEWVRLAQRRWVEGPPEGFALSCLGVDCARGGKDSMTIAPRYGYWFAKVLKYPGKSTPDGPMAAARVTAVWQKGARINVDVIGIGASVYDCLRASYGELVTGVNNAAATDITDKSKMLHFLNVRAASYWKLREALDPAGEEKLSLPPDPELLSDLCSARYIHMASGIRIESKEEIIKRIGRSPDKGDSCVLAYFMSKKKEFWVL